MESNLCFGERLVDTNSEARHGQDSLSVLVVDIEDSDVSWRL